MRRKNMRQLFSNMSEVMRKSRLAVLAAAAAMVLLVSASGAKAGCGEPFKAKSPVLSWMHEGQGESNGPATIVGLWHLKYTAADGSAFNETFKMWHADGTEWENALLPPSGQNFCYGVWKEISHLTVKLHHLGFMYSPDGTLQASFTIDEIDTVAQNNKTYSGTFESIRSKREPFAGSERYHGGNTNQGGLSRGQRARSPRLQK
jgi:hypothetical protein